ncbi:hypothetical protein BDY17DRAFT_305318 [Neohortaea acidophila]|uniref:Uncharacterized protein n=1 Tax=Neohortaea acidophila TaxID=245834 RepID=A0A6A6PH17_9PEZI|nr:uncharacterized protein BDY17DRAFT_305318 [Neohortaea acidophila]KAF2479298.1 hypothetical protein BDY17DRAFT_305318 [Neohortaea acidophila]
MSSNLMDTEPGGEQTQYEGAHTDVEPHKKSTGQMGKEEDKTTTDSKKAEKRAEQETGEGQQEGEKKAD